jgi:hypothetical protein
MGIFSSILEKLRRHANPGAGQATPTSGRAPGQQQQEGRGAPQPGSTQMANVDVEKILSDLAAKKGGQSNWRTSIVDTMKLLDMDSSLENRKELAQELGVNAGAHGSAEQNIALHKAVMKKIEENGGKVPDSMRG